MDRIRPNSAFFNIPVEVLMLIVGYLTFRDAYHLSAVRILWLLRRDRVQWY